MGWTTVETPNAVYRIFHEFHSRASRTPTDQLDALILENATGEPAVEHFTKDRSLARVHSSPGIENKPIFFADAPINPRGYVTSALRFTSTLASASAVAHTMGGPTAAISAAVATTAAWAAIPVLLVPGRELKWRKPILRLASLLVDLYIDPRFTKFRNALVAQKAEQVIAPQLAVALHRKPVIGIEYGAAHTGIVEMLKKPVLRRRTLSRFNTGNPEKAAIDTQIFEMHFNPQTQSWEGALRRNAITLPRRRPLSKRASAYWRLGRKKAKRFVGSVRRSRGK